MTFSVIVVNYNTAKLTADCLDSLWKYSKEEGLDVIIADNASSDGSFGILASTFGRRIKLIKNPVNAGFGAANNSGAAAASGDILFFLNSDTLLGSDVLSEFQRALADEKVAIAAPRLLLPDGQRQPYTGGKIPDFKSLLLRRSSSDIDDGKKEWVSGAALAIRKDVFKAVGGFDEKFFMYFEDMDLCQRVNSLGYKVAVCPEAKVVHFGGQSLGDDKVLRSRYYYQSQDYFCAKHYGPLAAAIVRIARFFYRFLK